MRGYALSSPHLAFPSLSLDSLPPRVQHLLCMLVHCGGEFLLHLTSPSSSSHFLLFLLLLLQYSSQFSPKYRSAFKCSITAEKSLTFYLSPLHCGWSSIWSKVLVDLCICPSPPPSVIPSHCSVFFFSNCQFAKNVGPLHWELLGLCPSILSPFLTPSLCHFTSAVKCSLSLSLSFPLTLQLSQSSFHLSQTLFFSLPTTKSVVWCWTNEKKQTTKKSEAAFKLVRL